MSRILRRPMFRGGPVDSRGSGITSGLDKPKRGLVDEPGGYAGEIDLFNIFKDADRRGYKDFTTGGDLLPIPNTFDITYMHQNTENKYMNKISSCFLRNMNVTYGGDRFTAYNPVDGSPVPQKSTITLSFGEIEVMHKDLIKRGY